MATQANNFCASCTAQELSAVRAMADSVERSINARFRGYVPTRAPVNVELVDRAHMNERWIDVRVQDWRRRHPKDDPNGPEARKYEAALRDQVAKFGGATVAFAYGDTIYVSPDIDPTKLTHEETHLFKHPAAREWAAQQLSKGNASAATLDRFNESLTEYFNRQVTGGVAQPRSAYFTDPTFSQYGTGADVLTELRDERLGGPVQGDAVLRAYFFGGDTRELQKRLDATGGAKKFFDDYDRRRVEETAIHKAFSQPFRRTGR